MHKREAAPLITFGKTKNLGTTLAIQRHAGIPGSQGVALDQPRPRKAIIWRSLIWDYLLPLAVHGLVTVSTIGPVRNSYTQDYWDIIIEIGTGVRFVISSFDYILLSTQTMETPLL